jgi:hypothetical protein
MVYPAGMIYTRKQEQEEHMRNWLWDRLRLPVSHSGSFTCESVFCCCNLLRDIVPHFYWKTAGGAEGKELK